MFTDSVTKYGSNKVTQACQHYAHTFGKFKFHLHYESYSTIIILLKLTYQLMWIWLIDIYCIIMQTCF